MIPQNNCYPEIFDFETYNFVNLRPFPWPSKYRPFFHSKLTLNPMKIVFFTDVRLADGDCYSQSACPGRAWGSRLAVCHFRRCTAMRVRHQTRPAPAPAYHENGSQKSFVQPAASLLNVMPDDIRRLQPSAFERAAKLFFWFMYACMLWMCLCVHLTFSCDPYDLPTVLTLTDPGEGHLGPWPPRPKVAYLALPKTTKYT